MATEVYDITVTLDKIPDDGKVSYIAPCPPDLRSSFSGSALPFANPQQAFEGTPNKGNTYVSGDSNNAVTLTLQSPNAYYVGLGTVYIPPTVYLSYTADGVKVQEAVQVSRGVPFRMLTYPGSATRPRENAMFYDVPEQPVRSQESILRASAYPAKNEMPPNFWGAKPPV
jgi:hypothetical protein